MAPVPGTPHPFLRAERPGSVPLVSPRELRRMLDEADPPMVVDVRSERERRLARLPNDRHLPLFELPKRFAELPIERSVVTYCQYGSDARRAAEFLRSHGYAASALEGGLDEYSRLVDPTVPRYELDTPSGDLLLIQLPRPESGCLAYFLGDPSSHRAVVIDPGRDVDPYLAALGVDGWTLSAIVETHTHADHLAGHAALHAKTGAPIYVSHRSPAQYSHERLREGDSIAFGREALEVLETPGHTRDHLTLRLRDKIFTGDTLLLGSCGRTDLGDGNPDLLWESLTQKILRLPDETEVFPAHFGKKHALLERYVSSIGFERGTNEALLQGSREAFRQYMTEGWPPKPADFDRIVRENLEG